MSTIHGGMPGSIPACAGEPPFLPAAKRRRRVYPRVCGGTLLRQHLRFSIRGLSPRVRGNRQNLARITRIERSIPACAGEPRRDAVRDRYVQVYPRVCGGTAVHIATVRANQGLSPRVRGNPAPRDWYQPDCGSIPACAGEPHESRWWYGVPWVYPRVCGGTDDLPPDDPLVAGLSPRVRGNRAGVQRRWYLRRSIPACAGEPTLCRALGPATPVYPRVCGGTA